MGLDYFPLDIKKFDEFFKENNYFNNNKEKETKLFDMFDDRFCKFIKKDGTLCGRKSRIVILKNCCKQHIKYQNKEIEKNLKHNKYYTKKEIIHKCIWVNKHSQPCKRNVKNKHELCCFHKKFKNSNKFKKNIKLNLNPLENKIYDIPKEKKKKEYIDFNILNEYRNYDCINFLENIKSLNFNIKILSYNYIKAKNNNFNFVIKNNYFYDNNTGFNDKGLLNLVMYVFKFNLNESIKYISENKKKYSFSYFSFGNKVEKTLSNEFGKIFVTNKNPLDLPKYDKNKINNVKNYLINKRFLDKYIINNLINQKMIYSDKYNNCIFLNEKKNFCTMRGISNIKYVSCRGIPDFIVYKKGLENDIYLFESPIDSLSYMTLNPEKRGHFVSTNGSMMINKFIKYNILDKCKNLYLCLDNDIQGETYCKNIIQEIKNNFNKINIIRIKPKYKDFNEDLINFKINK